MQSREIYFLFSTSITCCYVSTFAATNKGNDRLQINETLNGREKIGNAPAKKHRESREKQPIQMQNYRVTKS